jgi:hypothetical protein
VTNPFILNLNLMAKPKKSKSKPEGNSGRKGLAMDSFYAWDGDVLVLNILGTPRAVGAISDSVIARM